MLSGVLEALGGQGPADPLPAHPDNPDGYFEPLGVVVLNETRLERQGHLWCDLRDPPKPAKSDVAAAAAALGVSFPAPAMAVLKDPRICRMLPLWREAARATRPRQAAVFLLRPPAEIVASLKRRDDFTLPFLWRLWAEHVVAAEAASRDLPRLMLSYPAMLEAPVHQASRVLEFLAPGAVFEEAVKEKVAARVKPGLRREQATLEVPEPYAPLVAALDALMEADDEAGRAAVTAAAKAALAEPALDLASAEVNHRFRESEHLREAGARALLECQRLRTELQAVTAPAALDFEAATRMRPEAGVLREELGLALQRLRLAEGRLAELERGRVAEPAA